MKKQKQKDNGPTQNQCTLKSCETVANLVGQPELYMYTSSAVQRKVTRLMIQSHDRKLVFNKLSFNFNLLLKPLTIHC